MNAICHDRIRIWVTRTAREAIGNSHALELALLQEHAQERKTRIGYFRTAHTLATGEIVWVATTGQGHAIVIAPCRSFALSEGRDAEHDLAVSKVIDYLLQTMLSHRGAQGDGGLMLAQLHDFLFSKTGV